LAQEIYHVGLVQLSCSPDPQENLNKAAARLREAAKNGAQVVCLPELFRTQYFCQREDAALFDLAEKAENNTVQTGYFNGMREVRKKRQLAMGPVQQLKLRLLDAVDAADPEPEAFAAVVAQAIVVISDGGATGPAQAVASDLEMDWQLACTSTGFVEWLRTAAAESE